MCVLLQPPIFSRYTLPPKLWWIDISIQYVPNRQQKERKKERNERRSPPAYKNFNESEFFASSRSPSEGRGGPQSTLPPKKSNLTRRSQLPTFFLSPPSWGHPAQSSGPLPPLRLRLRPTSSPRCGEALSPFSGFRLLVSFEVRMSKCLRE